ncbi:hypothetical protein Lal_00006918 [Lupinus albus]|nr:hypothetical protein Lal_00006918 [Lupinus albus]
MKVTTRPDDRSERASRLHVVIAELLSAIIASTVSFDEMYQSVLDKARWLTESQHGFVSSIDEKTGAHISNTLTKMRDEGCTINAALYSLPEGPHKLYSSLWGYSLNVRESFFTNNPSSHAASVGLPSGHVPLKNFLSVPIMFGDEILGQIALANSVRDYTIDDLKEITRLGEVYAIVLHNRRQESDLQRSEEQFRSMVEIAPFPMLVTRREMNGTILYGNLRAAALFKVSQEELIGSTFADYHQNRDEWMATLDEIEKNGCAMDKEMQFYDVNGKVIWFGSEALMITINDVTDRKNMEETLRQLATVDYLTGIWNRRYIMDLGTAKVVTNELRGREIFGRYGGEEFAIVFPEISLREAAEIAERLRQAIETYQYLLENVSILTVTASFGISEVLDNDRTFEESLARADNALYKAKALGLNQNAFSNVQVNGTTVQSGNPEDTIKLKAGTNIELSADPVNKEVLIAVTGQVPNAVLADNATMAVTAGIAESANKLLIAHTINGISFDGTEDITIKAKADGGEADTLNGKSLQEIISECAKVAVPIGCIVIWSGSESEVPADWNLCDGSKGTPDLQDKFVLCVGSAHSIGATGGEAEHVLTIAEMPSHTHSAVGHETPSESTEGPYFSTTPRTTKTTAPSKTLAIRRTLPKGIVPCRICRETKGCRQGGALCVFAATEVGAMEVGSLSLLSLFCFSGLSVITSKLLKRRRREITELGRNDPQDCSRYGILTGMDSATFTFTNDSAIEAAYCSEFFNGHAMIKGDQKFDG